MAEEQELQGLLLKYRARLERLRRLSKEQTADLEWIRAHPPEDRLTEIRQEHEWTRLMLDNGVYTEAAGGKFLEGPNFSRLCDYEVNKDGLLNRCLRICSQGIVIPVKMEAGRVVPLPAENKELTPSEAVARKNWLFGLTAAERLARLQAVERMAYHKMELSELEKFDKTYLRELLPIASQTYKKKS